MELTVFSPCAEDLPEIADFLARTETRKRQREDGSAPRIAILTTFYRRFLDDLIQRPHHAVAHRHGGKIAAVAFVSGTPSVFTSGTYGYLHSLALAPPVDTVAHAAALLTAALQGALGRGWSVVKLRLPVGSETLLDTLLCETEWVIEPFREETTVVKRLDAPPDLPSADGVTIRAIADSDRPFVLDLITRAFRAGVSNADRKVLTTEGLKHAAEGFLNGLLRRGGGGFVAEEANGIPMGHALFEPFFPHEARASVAPRVHDVFVLDAYQNLGVAHMLSRVCERAAWSTGARVLSGTVNASNARIQGLLTQLIEDGWHATEICYELDLSPLVMAEVTLGASTQAEPP